MSKDGFPLRLPCPIDHTICKQRSTEHEVESQSFGCPLASPVRGHRYPCETYETLFGLCAAQPATSLVRGIYRYGDTVFNRYQLGLLLDEVEGIEARAEAGRQAVDLLRRAASIALRANGYLLFVGIARS